MHGPKNKDQPKSRNINPEKFEHQPKEIEIFRGLLINNYPQKSKHKLSIKNRNNKGNKKIENSSKF